MKTVSVSELKEQMSRYLREVRRGTEIEILDRGHPVARLVGVGSLDRADALAHMAADGLVRLGKGDARPLLKKNRLQLDHAHLGAAIREERDE